MRCRALLVRERKDEGGGNLNAVELIAWVTRKRAPLRSNLLMRPSARAVKVAVLADIAILSGGEMILLVGSRQHGEPTGCATEVTKKMIESAPPTK